MSKLWHHYRATHYPAFNPESAKHLGAVHQESVRTFSPSKLLRLHAGHDACIRRSRFEIGVTQLLITIGTSRLQKVYVCAIIFVDRNSFHHPSNARASIHQRGCIWL